MISVRSSRWGQGVSTVIATIAAGGIWSENACAQDLPDPVFLEQRSPTLGQEDRFQIEREDEADALGYRMGSLLLLPSMEIGGRTDNNVLARANGTSDASLRVRPRLAIDYRSGELQVSAFTQALVHRYATLETEHSEELSFGGKLERSFGPTARLIVQGEVGTYVEDRNAVFAAAQSRTPVEFDRSYGIASLVVAPGKLLIAPSLEVDRFTYEDNRLSSNPATLLPQKFRSFLRVEPSLLIGHQLSDATLMYVGGTYNTRDYDLQIPFNRDSKGYAIYSGIRFQLSPLTRLDIALGYMQQNYSGALADPKGVYARAKFDWTPSRRTLISFNFQRDISETGNLLVGGSTRTRASARITYELSRKMTLAGGMEYRQFQLEQINAQSKRGILTLGVQYRVARHVELFANNELLVTRGDAVATPAEYERLRMTVGLNIRL